MGFTRSRGLHSAFVPKSTDEIMVLILEAGVDVVEGLHAFLASGDGSRCLEGSFGSRL